VGAERIFLLSPLFPIIRREAETNGSFARTVIGTPARKFISTEANVSTTHSRLSLSSFFFFFFFLAPVRARSIPRERPRDRYEVPIARSVKIAARREGERRGIPEIFSMLHLAKEESVAPFPDSVVETAAFPWKTRARARARRIAAEEPRNCARARPDAIFRAACRAARTSEIPGEFLAVRARV